MLPPSLFSEIIYINWYYFFLKNVLWNALVKPSGPGIFFVGRVLIKNSSSLGDIGLFIFSISPASFLKELPVSSKLLTILIL